MSAFTIMMVGLMLLPFALLGVGGVLIIRSSYRSDRFIVLMNPWRQFLVHVFHVGDEQALRRLDRIAAWLVGGILMIFGVAVVIGFGTIFILWSVG